ncbi:FIP1[V]-like protein isoform X2 [Cajanus cajan]|uniref:FIP1[V]-like protein isoform X1 n=1 Tax=Cajanus cajan TaxID=3821 RepID=UPI00098D9EE8|nr:FIP1[V]-like protein isoform X1 [Cajanus cajan]XP_020205239.1 FIP1[V]-like protein isoform X2 [Cajanus cajan]
MEDDDDFGDLYSDVLRPFASPSSSAPQPHQSSPAPPSIDLNLNAAQIPCDAPPPDSPAPNQLPAPDPHPLPPAAAEEPPKILDAEPPQDSTLAATDEGVDPMDRDVKFDIEEEEEDDGGDVGSEPVIPGLSGAAPAEEGGEGDDWDSDSEDDLKIVLNENNHMAMERGGMGDGEEEEEDEDEGLVIVGADPNQAAEEQEWGENAAVVGEGGERKDAAELAKAGGAVAPKIGYSNHGYHPFHSQFKYQYVRPGAALMPGATTSAPGGPPGQIRPLANMAGRGRGDWRPLGMKGAAAMQKGFHAGPGLPGWGNSGAGRGIGGGLEFTLPSHKTIFDVDIESFEEKPWKYPNVDTSDFFNFGLNEDSWKDYCKQLEQLRLESTMQSKIRVYESGRTEQEYDPDLPPELAAATGIHDVPVENANSLKSDIGQSDVMKGSGTGRVRPPLPTGRAIQVEGGYGDRLPSIDTRPPRIRDSDAIIEIVLQDTEDDHSSAGIAQDPTEGGEPHRDDFREDHVDEIPRLEPEYFDGFPQDYNGRKKELAGRRMPFINSGPANMPNGNEKLFFPQEEPIEYSGSRDQNPRSRAGNFISSYDERQRQRRVRGQSPPITPIQELATDNNQKEESVESMEVRHSTHLSSPVIKDVKESSVEDKDTELEDTGTADGSSRLEKEETVDKVDTLEDGVAKRQKLTSQVDQPSLDEVDDWDDSKAAKSSDNSKARSASSRDNQKRREGFEEEVLQNPRSAHLNSIRQHPDEIEQGFYRREHDAKQEPERNRMIHKGRERPYPYKDRHPSSGPQLHTNTDGFDGQKERDNYDIDWARRDDDLYSRRVRNDEPRKRDRAKVRENERNDKEDSLHSRKQLDNGSSYRLLYDRDVGSRDSRHRERDESLRIRYEAVEDYHGKRRKDEEYLRREHIDKEEILHGYRENANRRRRDRDEVLDPRKRDDLQRIRENPDDQYAARQKDEAWVLRERGDRQRDREEGHRIKQSHEEHIPKREREEGRSSIRSGRGAEEKAWVGHVRAKDEHKLSEKEYQSREAMRHNDQLKRRDRIQDESLHHKGRDDTSARGNQYTTEERRSRQERSSSRSDRVANTSDNQKVKHREGSRKSKERVVSDLNSLGLSKRSQENESGPTNEKGFKGSGDEERAQHEIPGHRLSRKQREDVSSEDEQQDSRRGRSKLERWTSHKERDFSIKSASLKFKDIDKDNNDGSSEAGKPAEEPAKPVDVDDQHHLSAEARDSADMENKDADTKELGDRHLDTVERLKKRSERFKLPMPSEKEALVIKKLESEPLPSAKSENPIDSEVKQERPARKRRWITN